MIESFKVYYDRVTSFSAPGYEDEEILLFLNNAQDEFIKDRAFGTNFQPPAFEDNQKRVADLFAITKAKEVTTGISSSNLFGNSWVVQKSSIESDSVLYTIGIRARITRTSPSITNEYVECDEIKTENTGKFAVSSVNKTHFINPKYLEEKSGYYIIGDAYTTLIDRLLVNYVMKPQPITESIQDYNETYSSSYISLPSHTHQEIVDIAVRQALQVTQDPRWQTQLGEQQIKST